MDALMQNIHDSNYHHKPDFQYCTYDPLNASICESRGLSPTVNCTFIGHIQLKLILPWYIFCKISDFVLRYSEMRSLTPWQFDPKLKVPNAFVSSYAHDCIPEYLM